MKSRQQHSNFDSLPSLTPRQLEVWRYLSRCISGQGICPSYREIAQHLKIHSSYGVRTHLDALERKGYLKRIPNCSRAITLLKRKSTKSYDEIPRLGTIRGNTVTLSEEYSGRQQFSKGSFYPYLSLYVEEAPPSCSRVQKGYSLLLHASPIVEENRRLAWMTPKKELILGTCIYHSATKRYAIQRRGDAKLYFDWKKWTFLGIVKGWVVPIE
ncbi:MAG: hypothetical protein Q4D62_03740 [Planctomycetia bacterium]|nr:hypothetical protein [Planctomycetia bacterium]